MTGHAAPPRRSAPLTPLRALLLAFLLWRGADAVFLWYTQPAPLVEWRDGLTDTDEGRMARALDIPPLDAQMQRYRLLRDRVPAGSLVLVLHEYTDRPGWDEIRSYMRLSSLLYPLYMRMINALPAPPPEPAVRGRPTFLLDLRADKANGPGPGYAEVARAADAVLWRQEDAR